MNIEHESEDKAFYLQCEKLANFCYACSLNHVKKNCFAPEAEMEESFFGDWLRYKGSIFPRPLLDKDGSGSDPRENLIEKAIDGMTNLVIEELVEGGRNELIVIPPTVLRMLQLEEILEEATDTINREILD